MKSKISILITIGILFAFLPIITAKLSFISEINYFDSDFSDDGNLDNKNPKVSDVSLPIHIDDTDPSSNWAVAKATGICTGDGSSLDPYVIEDLVIDAGGSGSCIIIENSAVFVKIENCTVANSGSYYNRFYYAWDAGISLFNVYNVEIINNTVINNYDGIVLYSSEDNTITGNIVNNNFRHGINLYSSRYNAISANTATYNPIGIYLDQSLYNNISGSTAIYNNVAGIYLTDSGYNDILANNASYNSYYGIYLFRDCDRNTISGNDFNNNFNHGIYLYSSFHNTFSGNVVFNNFKHGIYLSYSRRNTISGNNVNCNNQSGICLSFSDSNTISGNTANNNSCGINFASSSYNDISGNYLIGNDFCIAEDENSISNFFNNNDCGDGEYDGISFELIIFIASIIGGAVLGIATLLLSRSKRKRK